jgi:hypothetical protein
MKFDELHELVQAHGFSKVVAGEEEEDEEAGEVLLLCVSIFA